MSWIAGSTAEVEARDRRRRVVPAVSTVLASMISLLPFILNAPVVPDFGFLVVLSWRLLRPEMWSAPHALWLGLLDDLISGNPIGQSMALWTLTFLALDAIDSRTGFRDYWLDWLLASFFILAHVSASWFIGHTMGARTEFAILIPQLIASVLAYPIVARMVLALDRWRLSR